MFDFFKKAKKNREGEIEKQRKDIEEGLRSEDLENVDASVTFHVTKDGKYYVDFDIFDLEDKTINNLSELLVQISKESFYLEMLEIVKAAFDNKGRGDIFNRIATNITDDILKNLTEKEMDNLFISSLSEKTKERPCFKPSDVL